MTKLLKKFKDSKPTVVVSLIQNSLEMAKKAEEGGADGLKLHVNLYHPPTSSYVSSYEEEKEKINQILEEVNIPIGIVPRGAPGTTKEEVRKYRDLGFDFVDFYGQNVRYSVISVSGITSWIAATTEYDINMIKSLSKLKEVDVIEAAFLPKKEFGAPLNVDDITILDKYLKEIDVKETPVVLPTDRDIKIDDLEALKEIGINNFMLGVAVTGTNPNDIYEKTKLYKEKLSN